MEFSPGICRWLIHVGTVTQSPPRLIGTQVSAGAIVSCSAFLKSWQQNRQNVFGLEICRASEEAGLEPGPFELLLPIRRALDLCKSVDNVESEMHLSVFSGSVTVTQRPLE